MLVLSRTARHPVAMKRAVSGGQSVSRMTRLKVLAAATAATPVMASLPMGGRLLDLDCSRSAVRMASSAPDIHTLTVPELKAELRQRGMPVGGVKAVLVARLATPELEAASPAATTGPAAATEAALATAPKAAKTKPAAKTTDPKPKKRGATSSGGDGSAESGFCAVEEGGCVLDLDGNDLVRGVVVCRPSARNKSPYVGDVLLEDGRDVLVHMPSMDMGGKCCAGAAVLMRPARDKKGVPVGSTALGPYGTPKCEFIMQLLRVEEPEHTAAGLGGVWIGAHPTIGERLAQGLIEGGLLRPELGEVSSLQREVCSLYSPHRHAQRRML